MSQYINFYLRVNDTFVPVGSYSRSLEIYQIAHNYVPYEHIVNLTEKDFNLMMEDAEARVRKNKSEMQKLKETISLIMSANSPLREKMAEADNIEEEIREIEESNSGLDFAYDIFLHFYDMINDARYGIDSLDNDYNHYIYAGIEAVGSLENVVEDK